MKKPIFKILYEERKTRARLGQLTTPHGIIHTPAFIPVGTQATVKSLTPKELEDIGIELFFVNTYHMYLSPGLSTIEKFGGLHRFMNWSKPIITDSGGFQVFSLNQKKYVNIALSESAVLDRERFTKKFSKNQNVKNHVYPDDYRPVGNLVKIDDDGVTFTSHRDGSRHRFTPEVSIAIQKKLGADIIIAFDECTPYPTTYKYAAAALARTHRWAERCLKENSNIEYQKSKIKKPPQALYGVVQGSIFKDLREQSADFISRLDFDGIAIGGVSVGESKEEMRKVCDWVVPRLQREKPRHLLGVGEIDDIFDIIERGIDTFDCVQPTRLARMGHIFQNQKFTVDITKKIFAEDISPIDANCNCYACQNFSRAYLHHLFRVRELLGYRLATIHNLYFVMNLVREIRTHIQKGSFREFKKRFFGG